MAKALPKSLHTVTVLVNVAKLVHKNRTISDRTAVHEAMGWLGYSALEDPYGLVDKAIAVLHKDNPHVQRALARQKIIEGA